MDASSAPKSRKAMPTTRPHEQLATSSGIAHAQPEGDPIRRGIEAVAWLIILVTLCRLHEDCVMTIHIFSFYMENARST